MSQDLPIIQKTYDLIKWYVPIINRLPRNHQFALGARMTERLYGLLDGLIQARYFRRDRLPRLHSLTESPDLLLRCRKVSENQTGQVAW